MATADDVAKMKQAEKMCVYLLSELQPALMTKMKEAIDKFTDYYFKNFPPLNQAQIEALLRGYGKTPGLLAACGRTSWKKFKLKNSAAKALGLLSMLLDENQNKHAAMFQKVLLGTDKALLRGMKIERHLSGSDRGNQAAARKISMLLQRRGSLSDIMIVTTVVNNNNAVPLPPGHAKATNISAPQLNSGQQPKMRILGKVPAVQPELEISALSRPKHAMGSKPPAVTNKLQSNNAFKKVLDVLTSFFGSRPDAATLRKKGVLKKGAFFAVPLADVVALHGANNVPSILVDCCNYLINHSLHEPGLFRVSGDALAIQHLKKEFDFANDVKLDGTDVHSVSGLMKLFLRDMPEPLLTFAFYDQFVAAARSEDWASVKRLASQLPSPNKETWDYLCTFLARVSQYQHVNKMSQSNLAIVFAPNILRPKVETYEAVAKDTPLCINVVKFLITEESKRLNSLVRQSISVANSTPSLSKVAPTTSSALPMKISISDAKPNPSPAFQSAPLPLMEVEEEQEEEKTDALSPSAAEPLPQPWVAYPDPQTGMSFYFNPQTNTTQWERPRSKRLGSMAPPKKSHATVHQAVPTPAGGVNPMMAQIQQKQKEMAAKQQQQQPAPLVNDTDSNAAVGSPAKRGLNSLAMALPRPLGPSELEAVDDIPARSRKGSMPVQPGAEAVSNLGDSKAAHSASGNSGKKASGGGAAVSSPFSVAASSMQDPEPLDAGKPGHQSTASMSSVATSVISSAESKDSLAGLDIDSAWSVHVDPSTGNKFYYNQITNQSSWEKPADFDETAMAAPEDPSKVRTQIFGGWNADTAGGCHPNYSTWRKNPQYSLYIDSEPGAESKESSHVVSVKIERTPEDNESDPPAIGFYVFKNNSPVPQKLYVEDSDHVVRSEFVTDDWTSCEFKLDEGNMYVLIPATFSPGYQGLYSITIECDTKVECHLINTDKRWRSSVINDEWKGVNAGGCRNNNTWENNPQYLITLSEHAHSSSPLVVVLSQQAKDDMTAIGFYVLNNDGDIVGKGAFMRAPEVHCQLDVDPSDAPFLVVPCTFAAGVEQPYSLQVYSSKNVAATLVSAV